MSFFSEQLKACLDSAGTSRQQLAERSGLSYQLIANLATERRQPDKEILGKLSSVLPAREIALILQAYWRDVCPPQARHLARIETASSIKEDVIEEPLTPYGTVAPLSKDLRDALEKLRAVGVAHNEWRSAIIALSKLIES